MIEVIKLPLCGFIQAGFFFWWKGLFRICWGQNIVNTDTKIQLRLYSKEGVEDAIKGVAIRACYPGIWYHKRLNDGSSPPFTSSLKSPCEHCRIFIPSFKTRPA